ncbi:MAG: NADH-quinone oxidoreductase subunit H [Coriobacteriia bacterium]|nr:NADH-quinone oxidoreductase subunit H [Coriobacteriia bacterium]
MATIAGFLMFAVIAPVAGCLLSGLGGWATSGIQGRARTPILRPYREVCHLIATDDRNEGSVPGLYFWMYLVFAAVAGGIIFTSGNLLLCCFVSFMSSLFLIMAGASTTTPRPDAGATGGMLQVVALESMTVLIAIEFFMLSNTFRVSGIMAAISPAITSLPFTFVGFVYFLTVRLRRSPFNLTELSGRTLALVEVAHWYEGIMLLAWTGLFFINGSWASFLVAGSIVLIVGASVFVTHKTLARFEERVSKCAWLVALALGFTNLLFLSLGWTNLLPPILK